MRIAWRAPLPDAVLVILLIATVCARIVLRASYFRAAVSSVFGVPLIDASIIGLAVALYFAGNSP